MIVVAAPGQGSQSQGFLAPWLEVDGVRETLGTLGEAAKVDLITHGTVSDDDTIRDTKIAQPLIVAASVVTGGLLLAGRRERVALDVAPRAAEFVADRRAHTRLIDQGRRRAA